MKLDNWQNHEPILLAFEEAWRNGDAPAPAEFAERVQSPVSIELLAELVMIDFEHRYRRNLSPCLDDYLERSPHLREAPAVMEELVRHELLMKQKSGEFPTEAEVDSRFGADSTLKNVWHDVAETSSHATHLVAQISPGTVIGAYVIEEAIGIGSFATVYAATDTRLNRRVAIKLLLQSSDVDPEIRLRMQREAKAIALVSHPCIVPIFETGAYHSHDYIVTRFVSGSTLAQHLKERSLPVRESIELARQLASALHAAHQIGVVHRDVKPANVMLEDGVPQLLDFGLAALEDASNLLTREGDLVGTPAYMPPEQADGRALHADGRSDVYSLGAMLYRLVCGRLPFSGTTSEVISQVLHSEARFPPECAQEIDRDVQVIVLKCLQKSPDDRYQDAGELEADLQRYLDSEPIQARPVSSMTRLRKWVIRRPALTAMCAFVGVGACISLYLSGQLGQAVSRLDNAQLSNQSTQRQLRDSATEAGILALQRGQANDANLHLQQSLQLGVDDRIGVLLKLVEANLMRSDLDACRRWWLEADQLLRSNDNVANPIFKEYQGLVTVWQAELALAGCHEFGSGHELMISAHQMPLPKAEQFYVEAMLAEDSLAAIEKLKRVLNQDTYHHRARLTLVTTQISLAMLGEASEYLEIARQLYPDSSEFILLQGLVNSLTKSPGEAVQLLQSLQLEHRELREWEAFYQFSFGIVNSPRFFSANGEFDAAQLVSTVNATVTKLPQQRPGRNWRLPFVTLSQYQRLYRELPDLLNSDPESAILLLDTMTQVHPESSLLLALGSLRLAQCSGDPVHADREIPQLEKAREVYQQSVSCPGLLRADEQLAWRAVFTISSVLASIMKHDVDKNMMRGLETTPHILESSVTRASVARTFAILNLNHDRYAEADRWIDHWMKLAALDSSKKQEAIWHKAVVSKRLKQWLDVVRWCDELKDLNPDYLAVDALRNYATNQLKKVLEETTQP